MREFGVDELDGPSYPTPVCDLTNALLEERSKIPINTLLVEILPRRAEAVIAEKGGLMSYETHWIKNGMSLKFICESRQVSKYFWQ